MENQRTTEAMDANVRRLEAAGWRVHKGGWPNTLREEARWDFCRPCDLLPWDDDDLIPLTDAAEQALRQALAGEPIPERGNDR
jgi:hypothetical protein